MIITALFFFVVLLGVQSDFVDDVLSQTEQSVPNFSKHLRLIQGVRIPNTTHHTQVLNYINTQFSAFGLSTNVSVTGGAKNLVGVLGHGQGPSLIISAHYDSVPESPGILDNGSGVAILIEAARILSQYSFQHSIHFISWDKEEYCCPPEGSWAWAIQTDVQQSQVIGVLNMDSIGGYSDKPNSQTLPFGFGQIFPEAYEEISGNDMRGDFFVSIADSNSQEFNTIFYEQAQKYVYQRNFTTTRGKMIPLNLPLPGSSACKSDSFYDFCRSDHVAFWERSIPAVHITDSGNFRDRCYHQSCDELSDMTPEEYQFMNGVLKSVLAAALNMAGVVTKK